MSGTQDDMTPLALGGRRDWVATAKVVAKIVGVLTPAIIGALTAYRTAAYDTQVRVQATKNKSEAGYQVTRQALEALEHRVLVLEQAAHRAEVDAAHQTTTAKRSKVPGHKAAPPPPPPIPVVVTANPKALPPDLDKAERQIYRAAAGAGAARAAPDSSSP